MKKLRDLFVLLVVAAAFVVSLDMFREAVGVTSPTSAAGAPPISATGGSGLRVRGSIMSLEARGIPGAIAIGLGATLVMDLWNLFLNRAFSIPSLNYCLLGRWLRHMPGGRFRHANITAAPQKPFECPVGWIAHYTIGVMFALVFVALAPGDWIARPTVLPALLYGIGTVVFPFFILQPSFGLGMAASRTPRPMQARLKSLVTHAVFGIGLYICALGLSYALRISWGWAQC